MYAIVEIAGQQFKVEEGKKIFVNKLEAEEGKSLEFDRVLLVEDNDKIVVGEPTVKDLVVEGKVLANVKGDKVIVFKKKRKKGYRVKNGHRQQFTQVEIVRIGEKGAEPKPAAKKTAVKHEEPETAVAEAVETEAKAAPKKAAPKKVVKKEEPAAKPKKVAPEKEAKKPAAKKSSKSKEKI
jgi:large subunit ribosomal protein L21